MYDLQYKYKNLQNLATEKKKKLLVSLRVVEIETNNYPLRRRRRQYSALPVTKQ